MPILSALPHGIKDALYVQTLTFEDAEPLSVTAQGLPPGLSLINGDLSGIPTEAGDYDVEFCLKNSPPQRMTLRIHEAVASIAARGVSIALSTGELDVEKFASPSADGMDCLVIHDIPTGESVDVIIAYPEDLTGQAYVKYGPTPDNPEPHRYVMPGANVQGNIVMFTLTDGGLGDDLLAADGSIIDPGGPGIPLNTIDGGVPAVLPIGEFYRAEFQALCQGGQCPANSAYEWSLIAGSMPSGLTLTGSGRTGVLSGTPTQSGSYPFTVQVLARGSVPTTTTKAFTTQVQVKPAITTLITHYYVAILNREPDAGGLAYWQSQASAPGANVKQVFRNMGLQFFASAEYVARNRSNQNFISDLYLTFLKRAPDSGGMTYWLGQLNGGVTRHSVATSFAYSTEFTHYMNSLGL